MGELSAPWSHTADRWTRASTAVIASLREQRPDLGSQVGHDCNEFFPFRGWASLRRDATSDEDVVISLDFKNVPHGVEYVVDIATSEGEVLAETPTATITATDDPDALEQSVLTAMDDVDRFLGANQELLAAWFRPESVSE